MRKLAVILFLVVPFVQLIAQPACGTNPAAGETCSSATPICDLNGYCGNTSSSYTADAWGSVSSLFGCGFLGLGSCPGTGLVGAWDDLGSSVENDSYLQFVASAASMTFNLWVTNSVYGDGIQMMVFKPNTSCGSGSVTSYFFSGQMSPGGPYACNVTGLTVGQTYYIMIDGFAGDVCDYVIGVSSGVALPVSVTPATQTICAGQTASISASNGSGSYTWTATPQLNTTSGASVIATPPSVAGTYSYVVSSASSNPFCPAATATATVYVTSCACTVTAGNDGPVCENGNVSLTASNVAGATSYSWSGPSGFSSASQNPTGVAVPITPGTYTYTVTVTDATSTCSSSTTVTVNSNPTVNAGGSVADVCQGATSTAMGGGIGGGATGGTWSGGAGTWTNASNPSAATYTASTTESGIITLTLTSSGGSCGTISTTKTINVLPLPTASVGSALSAICQGATSAPMGGSIGGSATGGTWSGGSGTWTNATDLINATYTAGQNESGSVTLLLTTSGGTCGIVTASKTITINPLPTVSSVTGGGTYCAGDVVSNVVANVSGSANWTVNYTLNGVAASASGSSSPITLGNSAGVYVVTGVSDANCSNTASGTQTITVNPLPAVTSFSGGGTYCAGNTVAAINASVTGSPSWTIDYTLNGAPLSVSGVSSPISLGTTAGTYVLVGVTDNNCTNTATGTQTITVNALPTVSSVAGAGTYCAGQSVTPITALVTGSSAWTVNYTLNGSPQTASGSSSPITLGSGAGTYVVTGVSDANCSNTATGTQVITINALPTVSSFTGGANYCTGDVIGAVTAVVTGVPNWTLNYTVNGVAQTAVGSSSPITLGNAAGTYVLTGISDANCSNTANGTQSIVVNSIPSAPTVTADQTYCSGDNLSPMTASGPSGIFTWYSDQNLSTVLASGSAITSSLTPSPIVGQTSYYVTNAISGCEGPAAVIVITIEDCVQPLVIPTALTPGGDGTNDSWKIVNLKDLHPNHIVYIYDRWGSPLYTSSKGGYEATPWDGKYNGKQLPVGSYFYVIDTKGDGSDKLSGTVSIIDSKK